MFGFKCASLFDTSISVDALTVLLHTAKLRDKRAFAFLVGNTTAI